MDTQIEKLNADLFTALLNDEFVEKDYFERFINSIGEEDLFLLDRTNRCSWLIASNISLIIAQKDISKTLPLSQYFFFGQYSSDLNLAFTAFNMAMIPLILLYLILQKYIVGGISQAV